MKKILSAVICAVMLVCSTACGKREESGMIKPEVRIGETSVTLLCTTIKDIEGASIAEVYGDKDEDALTVVLNRNGEKMAWVHVDNRDKDTPMDEKTIYHISFLHNKDVDFHGIRLKKSTIEDVDAIFGEPDFKEEHHRAVSLGDDFYAEFFADETVYELSLYKYGYIPHEDCGQYD